MSLEPGVAFVRQANSYHAIQARLHNNRLRKFARVFKEINVRIRSRTQETNSGILPDVRWHYVCTSLDMAASIAMM